MHGELHCRDDLVNVGLGDTEVAELRNHFAEVGGAARHMRLDVLGTWLLEHQGAQSRGIEDASATLLFPPGFCTPLQDQLLGCEPGLRLLRTGEAADMLESLRPGPQPDAHPHRSSA
jgi:hypothetical protein